MVNSVQVWRNNLDSSQLESPMFVLAQRKHKARKHISFELEVIYQVGEIKCSSLTGILLYLFFFKFSVNLIYNFRNLLFICGMCGRSFMTLFSPSPTEKCAFSAEVILCAAKIYTQTCLSVEVCAELTQKYIDCAELIKGPNIKNFINAD